MLHRERADATRFVAMIVREHAWVNISRTYSSKIV